MTSTAVRETQRGSLRFGATYRASSRSAWRYSFAGGNRDCFLRVWIERCQQDSVLRFDREQAIAGSDVQPLSHGLGQGRYERSSDLAKLDGSNHECPEQEYDIIHVAPLDSCPRSGRTEWSSVLEL